MTALCGGHSSSPQPGYGATVFVGTAAIGALLNNVPVAWAVPLASYLSAISYDLSQFCQTDPPPVPTITAADALALVTLLDPVGHFAAVAKFEQLVGAYAWHTFCQCDDVATPAAPAPPAAPVNLPQLNPPLPLPTVQPCAHYVGGPTTIQSNTTLYWFVGSGLQGQVAGSVGTPAGATSVVWTYKHTPAGSAFRARFEIDFFNDAGTFINADFVEPANGASGTRTFAVPPTATKWKFYGSQITGATPAGMGTVEGTADFYCGGQAPGQTVAPCCPPDPILTGQLSQILELVTLMQRQLAPFAYVPGPAHSGLVGTGQFTIDKAIIGLKIELTTVPNYTGDLAGTPDRLFEVGFVSVGDADGFWWNRRLSMSRSVWFPEAAGSATIIGYTLEPNVVARITELVREP